MYSVDQVFIADTRPPIIQDFRIFLSGLNDLGMQVAGTDETTMASGATLLYSFNGGPEQEFPIPFGDPPITGDTMFYTGIIPNLPIGATVTARVALFDDVGNRAVSQPLQVTIPEPSTIVLLGIGLVVLAGYGWRRRKQIACKTFPSQQAGSILMIALAYSLGASTATQAQETTQKSKEIKLDGSGNLANKTPAPQFKLPNVSVQAKLTVNKKTGEVKQELTFKNTGKKPVNFIFCNMIELSTAVKDKPNVPNVNACNVGYVRGTNTWMCFPVDNPQPRMARPSFHFGCMKVSLMAGETTAKPLVQMGQNDAFKRRRTFRCVTLTSSISTSVGVPRLMTQVVRTAPALTKARTSLVLHKHLQFGTMPQGSGSCQTCPSEIRLSLGKSATEHATGQNTTPCATV
jgi:hypothetical protein